MAAIVRQRLWLLVTVVFGACIFALFHQQERLTSFYETTKQRLSPSSPYGSPVTNEEVQGFYQDDSLLVSDGPTRPDEVSSHTTPETVTVLSTQAEITAGETVEPPVDYLAIEKDDDWCESNYGREYLDFIAEHHLPYCEASSASKIECFRTHGNDEFCMIQGVKFDAADIGRPSVNCDLRNFTTERAIDATKAKEYKDIKNIENFRDYFFGTGAGPQLWDWTIQPSTDTSCSATKNNGKYYLYVRREGNRNLWHKLMELWQAMVTIDVLQMAINPSTGRPYLASSAVKDVQLVFEDNEIGPVYDLWGLITGSLPLRRSDLPSACMGNVILPLAGSSSPFWQGHWENKDCTERFMIKAFLRRIYNHLGIEPKQRLSQETVITIIDRKSSRRIMHLNDYAGRLRTRHEGVIVQVIDFAALSLKEQIETMRGTDVLVGVIGAGMTHLMFLPKESSVAEIIPPGNDYAGFRNLAKMRKLNYFTLHGQSGEEWNATVAEAESGRLRDLAFSNEAPGSQAVVEGFDGTAGDWQAGDIWLTNDEFQKLVDAAVSGQANRGLRKVDVLTDRVRTKLEKAVEPAVVDDNVAS